MTTFSGGRRFYTYDGTLFIPDRLYNWMRFLVPLASYGLFYLVVRLFTTDRAGAALLAAIPTLIVIFLFFVFVDPHRSESAHYA